MAIKASDQVSVVDLTDGYAITLTSEAHVFPGTTSAAKAGSVTTQVIAMCGEDLTQAGVALSEITKPSGVTVTSDNDTMSPTLTIAVDTTVKQGGTVKIPVHVGNGLTITKEFSFTIAFTGATGAAGKNVKWYSGTGITGTSTTATVFSGSGVASAAVGDMYLNSSTGYFYECTTAGNASTAKWVYKGSIKGPTGAAGKNVKWYSGTGITGTSTTATVFSGSGVASAVVGDMYLNTSTGNTYECTTAGAPSAAKWVYKGNIKGAKGDAGADAITISITSSNGTIFKNTSIATVLTAHVYKGGKELTANEITALGAIKWYKDGGSTAVATGQNLTIDAGDVTNKATYVAQLEG